jgi:hypothetical protein
MHPHGTTLSSIPHYDAHQKTATPFTHFWFNRPKIHLGKSKNFLTKMTKNAIIRLERTTKSKGYKMNLSKSMVACAIALWGVNVYSVEIAGVDVDEKKYSAVIKNMPPFLETLGNTLKTLEDTAIPEAIKALEANPHGNSAMLKKLQNIRKELPAIPKALTEYAVKFDQKMFDSEEMDIYFTKHPEFFESYFPTPDMRFLFMGQLEGGDANDDTKALFNIIKKDLREPFLEVLKKING